jgi:CRISPR-associated protein Cas1
MGVTMPVLSPKAGDLRMLQYRMAMDPEAAMAVARTVVTGKCANAVAVLRLIQSNHPGEGELSAAMGEIAESIGKVAVCDDAERLLGLEGSAAAAYFGALSVGFRGEIGFVSRQRRPPPDPANALLSFGYVLLGNLMGGLLEARGLDPSVGFFHAVQAGRYNLALDLLEEFRHPVVDRFVMRTCNLRILRPEMFEPDEENPGGVRLTRDGLKVFFRAWGEHLEKPLPEVEGESSRDRTPMALLRRQVDRFAAMLRGGDPYQPFLLRG